VAALLRRLAISSWPCCLGDDLGDASALAFVTIPPCCLGDDLGDASALAFVTIPCRLAGDDAGTDRGEVADMILFFVFVKL
jgi:hypothetical protein